MAEKRFRTEALLETLMLRMDAMDHTIASLKAQPSSSGWACDQADRPQRAGAPPRKAFPPALRRVRGQRKGKGASESQAEATPEQVPDCVDLPLRQSGLVHPCLLVGGQPWSGGMGQVTAQTVTTCVVLGRVGTDAGVSSVGETSQRDLVGHLA
ncbi:hypothetical protein NDU88_007899 [Pleurodeles waltl]|uniref:Uncharacterized protein n=1 Tax=Pleurodeles waltl TaxID=8319 RepID=A0AAV7QM41_PLEWA|nr:hypothetical protein NDU88_007899 [Pleurodeles waltl]